MIKSTTTTKRDQREARWRKLIDRQAVSGRSVAAFCRDESIPAQTFYWWKARLGKGEPQTAPRAGAGKTSFIDLGTVGAAETASGMAAGIDIRLELPGGVTLTIARR